MSAEGVPDPHVFTCGCRLVPAIIDGTKVLQLHACRAGCRIVAMTLEEADAQNKPAEVREAGR